MTYIVGWGVKIYSLTHSGELRVWSVGRSLGTAEMQLLSLSSSSGGAGVAGAPAASAATSPRLSSSFVGTCTPGAVSPSLRPPHHHPAPPTAAAGANVAAPPATVAEDDAEDDDDVCSSSSGDISDWDDWSDATERPVANVSRRYLETFLFLLVI